MIKVILSLINIILLFVTLFRFKRDMRWQLRSGANCYNCKEPIDNENSKRSFLDEDFRLCQPCERERKIKIVKNKFSIDTIYIKKYFLSKKFHNVQWYMIFFMMVLLSVDLFVSINYNSNLVGYISTSFNTIFYILWIYSVNLARKPKGK
jgi:hypothetical protein